MKMNGGDGGEMKKNDAHHLNDDVKKKKNDVLH
jgi:hypothetical protein